MVIERLLRAPLLGPLLALSLASAPLQAAPELRVLLPSNHGMPWVDLDTAQPRGILAELGQALADTLKAPLRFVVRPSLRVSAALQTDEADLLCYVKPGWVAEPVRWTRTVLRNQAIVAARAPAAPLASLRQLQGQVLGGVSGYRYPMLEASLSGPPRRDDAPTMLRNLAKLAAGRMDYALTDRITLHYHARRFERAELVEVGQMEAFDAQCALAPRSPWALEAIDQALASLERRGELQALLARHRNAGLEPADRPDRTDRPDRLDRPERPLAPRPAPA